MHQGKDGRTLRSVVTFSTSFPKGFARIDHLLVFQCEKEWISGDWVRVWSKKNLLCAGARAENKTIVNRSEATNFATGERSSKAIKSARNLKSSYNAKNNEVDTNYTVNGNKLKYIRMDKMKVLRRMVAKYVQQI